MSRYSPPLDFYPESIRDRIAKKCRAIWDLAAAQGTGNKRRARLRAAYLALHAAWFWGPPQKGRRRKR